MGGEAFRQREQLIQRLCSKNVPGLLQNHKGAQACWNGEHTSSQVTHPHIKLHEVQNKIWPLSPFKPSAIFSLFINVKFFEDHNLKSFFKLLLYFISYVLSFFFLVSLDSF